MYIFHLPTPTVDAYVYATSKQPNNHLATELLKFPFDIQPVYKKNMVPGTPFFSNGFIHRGFPVGISPFFLRFEPRRPTLRPPWRPPWWPPNGSGAPLCPDDGPTSSRAARPPWGVPPLW